MRRHAAANKGRPRKKSPCNSIFLLEATTLRKACFDIFSGAPDEEPVWMEAVEKLSDARERMEQIGAEIPGRYFLFSAGGQSVVAQIWTFKRPSRNLKFIGSAPSLQLADLKLNDF